MFRFLLAVALFFVIANPALFKITREFFFRFRGAIASADGLPTQAGVLLHALVFVLAGRFVGRFSRYADEPEKYAEETSSYADETDKYVEEYADEPEKYAEETSSYAEEYTMAPGDY
jgi:hypothetical protein